MEGARGSFDLGVRVEGAGIPSELTGATSVPRRREHNKSLGRCETVNLMAGVAGDRLPALQTVGHWLHHDIGPPILKEHRTHGQWYALKHVQWAVYPEFTPTVYTNNARQDQTSRPGHGKSSFRLAITMALAPLGPPGHPLAGSDARQAGGVLKHAPFRFVRRSDCRLHASEVRQHRVVLCLSALKHRVESPRRQPTRGPSATARL
ncbi:hypothetical protein PMIN01_11322 [Paraphaeosphaeria minitans]|uniref:Uncharacterized protein n=1 Tax=Paraphaeosphaeria minitans TaxID=565426 RepID=A0A9P6G8H3_9PLEO|nr:hypothetical protein PMIN01_11322 [Paraphaeosphaeria minitans]